MRPVSDRWLSAIRGSHEAIFEARVVVPGASPGFFMPSGTDPTGTTIPLESGNVRFDIESEILATCEITVPGEYWPASPASLLTPYGNELFLRRGINYGGGAVEWVSLGYFRINTVEQDDARGGAVRVQGSDRMWRIVKNPVTVASFSAATTRGAVIAALIESCFGTGAITIVWDSASVRDTAVGRQVLLDNDRWQVMNDLILSLGKIWYFDYRGYLVIKSPPSSTTPVWTVDAGKDGVLLDMGRSYSDENMANLIKVIGAVGDGAGQQLPIEQIGDGDITSPTWTGSKFGVISRVIEDSQLQVGQTNAVAKAALRAALGLPYQVDFGSVPNAALEPYDPIRVRLNNGVDDVHVLRSLTIPLDVTSPFVADTRQYVSREF